MIYRVIFIYCKTIVSHGVTIRNGALLNEILYIGNPTTVIIRSPDTQILDFYQPFEFWTNVQFLNGHMAGDYLVQISNFGNNSTWYHYSSKTR